MKSRAYIGFLLLAAASACAPAVGLAQTIPDPSVVPLKKWRFEAVHGDRTHPGEHYRRDALESMEVGDFGFAQTGMVQCTPGELEIRK